jgi:hypothetical protein
VFSDSVVWYHLLLPLSNAFFWHRILELYSKATSYYANIMGKCPKRRDFFATPKRRVVPRQHLSVALSYLF